MPHSESGRIHSRPALISAAVLLAAAAPARPTSARAQPPAAGVPAPAAPGAAASRAERYQLPNGLTVLLAPDRTAQVVAVDVWYDVGSRDERPERAGYARLMERLMQQGSANVRRGEHAQLVARAGGQLGSATTADRTGYFTALPAHQLELGLWLEADRMRSLAITQPAVDANRDALRAERRQLDARPYAGTVLDALARVYDARLCAGYARPTLGGADALPAASAADVRAFAAAYYTPGNATLALAGDFDPADARRLVARHFGDVARATRPAEPACDQPLAPGERRDAVSDAAAPQAAVLVAWRVPAYGAPDLPAVAMLASVLARGRDARLPAAAVRGARAAAAVQPLLNPFGPTRGPGVFAVLAVAARGVTPDSLERVLRGVVARVVAEGVSDDELARAKVAYATERHAGLETAVGRAEATQAAHAFLGAAAPGAAGVDADLARHAAVTAADVRRVAARYLVPANTSVTVIRAGAAGPPGVPNDSAAAPGGAR